MNIVLEVMNLLIVLSTNSEYNTIIDLKYLIFNKI